MISKKILLPLFIFGFVYIAGSTPGYARMSLSGETYPKPIELKLAQLVKRSFPVYFNGREELVAEAFYPIGWSRDGKFAYYTEPVDEACGCYFAKLFILDLKTDSVLWTFDFDGDPTDEAKKAKKPYSIETLWREKRALFSSKLREFGIIPQGRFAVLTFPLRHKGDLLTPKLGIVENTGEESRLYGVVKKATLQLVSKRNGKKTLFDQLYPDAMPLDMKVLAFLKSPFESRIAVILVEVYRGYEGPPHTGKVKIAGASLTTGFK